MSPTPETSSIAERELCTSRLLDAPPAAVYGAFADPAQLARWWGPSGFTNTIEVFELRPGGEWRLTMHGPDGRDYANLSRFTEVQPGERIVFVHDEPHGFEMTLTFDATPGGRTRLGWRMRFESAEACERVRAVVVPSNEQNIDRLAALLQAQGAARPG